MRGAPRILVVEDDPAIRELLCHLLEREGYRVRLAPDAAEARRRLTEDHFDVAICDVRMPGESGVSLARHIGANYPYTATLIATAYDDRAVIDASHEHGVHGYVLKPFRASELLYNVGSALRRLAEETLAERERELLEDRLERTAAELAAVIRQRDDESRASRSSEVETMQRLATTVEHRCRETAEHIQRVGTHSASIAERLGLSAAKRDRLRVASTLHDIGKVAVPDRILLKPARLSAQERRQMERHAEIGHDLLAHGRGELMGLASSIAWTHHERVDGGGYPRGLTADDIPLEGRIVAVADVFDALTHGRCYRHALSVEQTVSLMSAERGRHFDPAVLDAFLASLRERSQTMAAA